MDHRTSRTKLPLPTIALIACAGVSLLSACALFEDVSHIGVSDAGNTATDTETPPADMDGGSPEDQGPAGSDAAGDAADLAGDLSDVTPADASDASDADTGTCEAPLIVTNLASDWTTPDTIRWSWDWARTDLDLQPFELVVGETENDVINKKDVRIFTSDVSGELAVISGSDRVTWSVTWGLEPDTTYHAQLIARDPDGCVSTSDVATAKTRSATTDEVVIFSESPTDGYSQPSGVALSDRDPYQGTFHYEWLVDCGNEATCFEYIRRVELDISTANLPATDFEDAYLEFATRNGGSNVGTFEAVRFSVRAGASTTLWRVENRVRLAPGDIYRLHQIPLAKFVHNGNALTHSKLTSGTLHEFSFGSTWDDDTYVSFDELKIVW